MKETGFLETRQNEQEKVGDCGHAYFNFLTRCSWLSICSQQFGVHSRF